MKNGKAVAELERERLGPSGESFAVVEYANGIMLDIGCGQAKQRGFVGMDMRALPGVDIVWDIEELPWTPLPDDSVLTAIASHLVEHINPAGRKMPDGTKKGGFIAFMDEVWRVMKPDGQFVITVPYAGSPGYWQDPTHCNPCSEVTFAYFDPLENRYSEGWLYKIYKPMPWEIQQIDFQAMGNLQVLLRKRRWDPSYGCPDPTGLRRPYEDA